MTHRRLWWMTKEQNYGDLLSPIIFDHFGIAFQSVSAAKHADTLCVGSIITLATPGCLVLGSGVLKKKNKIEPRAQYAFVRGPETRNLILDNGGTCPDIYGDPALLLPLICERSRTEHRVGIVPHVSHFDEAKTLCPDHKIINLQTTDPLSVCREITSCDTIISSSLHGIITAHAFGIPAAWIKFSTPLVGDDIKFVDYFRSVGLEPKLSSLEKPEFSVPKLDTSNILEIFQSLSSI